MLNALDLILRFDPAKLQSDLDRIQPHEWAPHYNERDYGGDWRGVALRSVSGEANRIVAQGDSFADTELLERCGYFREVLSGFECRLKSVRLLSLAPRSFVREHSDHALGFESGEVRIHVPVQTNSGVEFHSCGERLRLDEGGCYYIDVSKPHRVSNRGSRDRVHLVIDAEVNDWIRGLFAQGRPVERIQPEPNGFAEFRRVVLSDPALQRRLHAIGEPCAFSEETIRIGRELAFEFDAADVEARTNVPREPAPPVFSARNVWVPVTLYAVDAGPEADWVYFGTRRFTEPFFENDVTAALRNPFTRAFRRRAPLPEGESCAPCGFVFHVSRCGSTLAARMLATLPDATVVSEAPILDEAIQSGRTEWVRSAIAALRLDSGPYFIKFDAWHIHDLPLIRDAFPRVPWVFLYREPIEVLESHRMVPGRMTLPGAMDPAILRLKTEDITGLSRDEWSARVLAGFCESALQHARDPLGLLLNYRDLLKPDAGVLLRHFGISVTDTDLGHMTEIAAAHAKFPSQPFQPDEESKRRAAPESLRRLCGSILEPLYRDMETRLATRGR